MIARFTGSVLHVTRETLRPLRRSAHAPPAPAALHMASFSPLLSSPFLCVKITSIPSTSSLTA